MSSLSCIRVSWWDSRLFSQPSALHRSSAAMRRSTEGPAGDPVRAAEILVQVAKRRDVPYHLPLGVTAAEGSIRLDEHLLAEDRKWRAVSRSADFAEPYPAEFPPDTAD